MNASAVTEVNQPLQHTVYLFDGFQLDVTRRKLVSSGGLVQTLNTRAMDALLLLVTNAGELVEKRRLMQTVWPNAVVEDNNLNQCVLAIRKALGEAAGSNRYIMTVPGRGYRFVCPVRVISQESPAETMQVSALRWRRRWLLGLVVGGAAGTLIGSVAMLPMQREAPDTAMAVVELVPTAAESSPAIELRLFDPPRAKGNELQEGPATVLAHCLAARPDLQLHVQLDLRTEAGERVWVGSYAADVQNPLAMRVKNTAGSAGCRELIAAQHPGQPGP